MGSTAGGVLQTGQRIGLAVGQAVIGAVFFNSVSGTGHAAYSQALRHAVLAALCFVALAVAIGTQDLARARRRTPTETTQRGTEIDSAP
jgi:phosphotransferase system  glucose/maltose/N-acetylglucosamine-specific IIC component